MKVTKYNSNKFVFLFLKKNLTLCASETKWISPFVVPLLLYQHGTVHQGQVQAISIN